MPVHRHRPRQGATTMRRDGGASWANRYRTRLSLLGKPTIRCRAGPGKEDTMAPYIFVVPVQHPALYDYLLQRFADDPNAQVVLDRRRIERRRADTAVARERRQAERRQRPDVMRSSGAGQWPWWRFRMCEVSHESRIDLEGQGGERRDDLARHEPFHGFVGTEAEGHRRARGERRWEHGPRLDL